MSALGQKRTCAVQNDVSALPRKRTHPIIATYRSQPAKCTRCTIATMLLVEGPPRVLIREVKGHKLPTSQPE